MKSKPEFLIVGAAKSGTTSLFHYLTSHPNIFIPEIKECRFFSQLSRDFVGLGAEFFANGGINNKQEYFSLFEGREEVCGDISNDYLYYYAESIKNIKRHLDPNVKIVVILRNPIDRAYSNYMHHMRDGWEDLSFEDAINQEANRISENWSWGYHYTSTGMYFKQVSAYLNEFKNVKIYLFEDLKNTEKFLDSLFDFLEVDRLKRCDLREVHNISGHPKSLYLHKLFNNDNIFRKTFKSLLGSCVDKNVVSAITARINAVNLHKVPINPPTREKLVEVFADDVTRLSDLIKRDLSGWLK